MKSKLLLLFVIFTFGGATCIRANNQKDNKEQKICVKLIYDEPIEGYVVTADWQPFKAMDCETGLITINFRNISTGKEFQYVNNEKFSSYHTDLITFAEGFGGYKNGDTYTIQYISKPSHFEESQIDYYLPFQFYDVDFDGEKELLISDYYQGQQGNYYEVFEITDSGLEAKTYPPFNDIDNMTMFDSQNKIITSYTHSGIFSSSSTYFQKIDNSAKQDIIIPDNFDEILKQHLIDITPETSSDFHIIGAEITINEKTYNLKINNDKWEIIKHHQDVK